MCGIFGFSLKPNANRKIALQKFKILGLYNISRGRDSSGIFVNGEIIKTIDEFDDFIEDKIIPFPKENGVMLGHTRQGSVGYKKTIDEAHPHLINDRLVFTHNGTIKNTKELCEKYRKLVSDFSVDSQILGTILDEDGPTVLEDYIGYAALAYTYKDEPNVLYLYHGESRDIKNGSLLEERPLYFMETKEGVYYSSLGSSLEAIKTSDDELVENLTYSTIFKIENGQFILDDVINIMREDANVFVYVPPVKTDYSYNRGKHNQAQNWMMRTGDGDGIANNSSGGASTRDEILIKKETLPIRLIESKDKKGFIYYHQGRYWKAPRTLVEGLIYVKKGGVIGEYLDTGSKLEFYWAGAMLKSKNDFDEINRLNLDVSSKNWVRYPNEHNFALMLSKYSKYPITNIGIEGFSSPNIYKHCWYEKGAKCKDNTFTPAFSNGRNYKVYEGYLIKISASQREDTLWKDLDLAFAELKALNDGTLLSGVPGGVFEALPFHSESNILDLKNRKGAINSVHSTGDWWYEAKILSEIDSLDRIGEDEMESLRNYISITHKNDFNLSCYGVEREVYVQELIDRAMYHQTSIIEAIDTEEDRKILIKCYENQMEMMERRSKLQLQSVFNFLEDDEITSKITDVEFEIINNKIEEDEMTKEEVIELTEAAINDLEDIQAGSMELMDAQDSDLAQDVAGTLLDGANNTLANLESLLNRHGESDLVKRVRKIRETKSMKDGVL